MSALNDLRDALSFIRGEHFDTVTLALATFDETTESPTYRQLQISDTIANDFSALARDSLRGVARSNNSGDLVIREYDVGYKPDSHEIEWLPTAADGLQRILCSVPTPAGIPLLGDIEGFIDHVRFYVIILSGSGGRVVLFRRYSRNMELMRSEKITMRFAGERYDRLEEPTFQFASQFDAVLYKDRLFVLNRSNVQYIFRYYDVLRQTADAALNMVRIAVPIAGFDEFRESCLGHLQKLEKLRNIAAKPYIQKVTMKDIKRTIQSFSLSVEVTAIDGKERLVFDRKDRWAILHLLDDAYLGSEMTGLKYETNSKREV